MSPLDLGMSFESMIGDDDFYRKLEFTIKIDQGMGLIV